jgi:predicted ATPase
MLTKLKVEHYKSLFNTEIDLEPLTIFIGPNGSGKSNICESLAVLSDFRQKLVDMFENRIVNDFLSHSLQAVNKNQSHIESKFWHGQLDYLSFMVSVLQGNERLSLKLGELSVIFKYSEQKILINTLGNVVISSQSIVSASDNSDSWKGILQNLLFPPDYISGSIAHALRKVCIYDFNPFNLSNEISSTDNMTRTGQGIAYALADILFSNRKSFDELEERLRILVPNIQRISLLRGKSQTFSLQLVDKYSENPIPASDISDGTLRILAFLTALYQEDTPSIICFEEIENGVHPWLLHKMMELLKLVSTEGITGKPVQVLITTHSPVLLNYVEPHQVRAVELDNEGKTQVHNLPTDSVRFQKALEAYDGSLGELWFTNQFGGNPV